MSVRIKLAGRCTEGDWLFPPSPMPRVISLKLRPGLSVLVTIQGLTTDFWRREQEPLSTVRSPRHSLALSGSEALLTVCREKPRHSKAQQCITGVELDFVLDLVQGKGQSVFSVAVCCYCVAHRDGFQHKSEDFFPKKEGWGEGIGGDNFKWWKAKRRSLCAQGATAGRVSRST